MAFIKEFKEFAVKGNLVDIATAFVMGAAFGKIVTGFTEGIVSPIISLLTGGVDFAKKTFILRHSTEVKDATGAIISGDPELTLKWGALLTATIDFVIVAFFMFLVIKTLKVLKRKEAVAIAPAVEPTTTEKLLMEIRDALKK